MNRESFSSNHEAVTTLGHALTYAVCNCSESAIVSMLIYNTFYTALEKLFFHAMRGQVLNAD